MTVLLGTLGRPAPPPSVPAALAPASTGGFAARTRCTLGASALRDMLEGSASWIRMRVLPALATMGPCAWAELVATAASASRGSKAGTVTWRWTNAFPTPVGTGRPASTRSGGTLVFVPETILVSAMTFEIPEDVIRFLFL